MQLRYYVPFKAEEGVQAEYALKEKLLIIEGVAIDTSVNANKWQVPPEDLDFLAESLNGAQLRVDHAESALMVVGKVTMAKREGDRVPFRAEVGDEKLIEKIVRGYLGYVSVQVGSDHVECSKCKRPTRREGMLIHLCPGAWEVVHKPKARELSIVASPAYEETRFQPVGFYKAMNESQWKALIEALNASQSPDQPSKAEKLHETIQNGKTASKSSFNEDDNVGSKAEGLQEPEQKLVKCEVKPLDSTTESLKAQAVVNTAPGEQAPKQVEYEDFIKQLETLSNEIKRLTAEVEAVKKSVEASEAGKKLAEIAKKKSEETAETAEKKGEEASEAAEAKRSGKGIVAVDVVQGEALANYEWFRDLMKAHRRLVEGFK